MLLISFSCRVPLLVKPTEIRAQNFGLFTRDALSKGQFISLYAGKIISSEVAVLKQKVRKEKGLGNYILTLREIFGKRIVETNIDPTEVGNVGRFASKSHSSVSCTRMINWAKS